MLEPQKEPLNEEESLFFQEIVEHEGRSFTVATEYRSSNLVTVISTKDAILTRMEASLQGKSYDREKVRVATRKQHNYVLQMLYQGNFDVLSSLEHPPSYVYDERPTQPVEPPPQRSESVSVEIAEARIDDDELTDSKEGMTEAKEGKHVAQSPYFERSDTVSLHKTRRDGVLQWTFVDDEGAPRSLPMSGQGVVGPERIKAQQDLHEESRPNIGGLIVLSQDGELVGGAAYIASQHRGLFEGLAAAGSMIRGMLTQQESVLRLELKMGHERVRGVSFDDKHLFFSAPVRALPKKEFEIRAEEAHRFLAGEEGA